MYVSIFWGPLQSVLIFHPYNFYSTASVHENEMDIFFRKRRKKQDTSGCKRTLDPKGEQVTSVMRISSIADR